MTPTQSRELASLIQTFSPSQKADFYYFTIVQNQDPIAYVAQMQKHSLVDLIKASFGGDRSAAGRYAAEQRWKGNRKKDKPKVERKKKQLVDKRLVEAREILDRAFGGDAISALRLAGTRQGDERKGVEIGSSGLATNFPPRDEEIRLAKEIEAAGALINTVIGEELAKLTNSLDEARQPVQDKLNKLKSKMELIKTNNQEFSNAGYGAMSSISTEEVRDALGKINPLYKGSELSTLRPIESVDSAVKSAQRLILSKIVTGEIDLKNLSSLSDNDLFALVARDTTKFGRGNKKIARMAIYGDSYLHNSTDLTENPPYTREQKNQAFLTLLRQQLNGNFGNTIRSEAPKLGDIKQNEKVKAEIGAVSTELKSLEITPTQRQGIVKKALGDIGVVFGKAGQVPVAMQGKTEEDTNSYYGRKITVKDAVETARGRKFQGLIDEAVQLLPKKLWEGSAKPLSNDFPAKNPTNIELDIRNGRAHAQFLRANPGVSATTKLKLESVKLDEEPSTSWRSVALHEMGHAAENSNFWLTQMQYAYWDSRRAGEPTERLSKLTGNKGYKSYEVAVKDKWGEPYAGKLYGPSRSQSFEIFTMGIESVFYGTRNIDVEHRDFTLGLLALSTQVKD